jgi:transcriptional regulator with XRE-family HTH domain
MAFGMIVKNLRAEKKLTLEDLGKLVKKSKGYLSGIENQKVRPPTPKIVASLAASLGFDANILAQVAYVEKAPKSLTTLPEFQAFKQSVMSKVPSNLLGDGTVPAEKQKDEKPPVAVPVEEKKL